MRSKQQKKEFEMRRIQGLKENLIQTFDRAVTLTLIPKSVHLLVTT